VPTDDNGEKRGRDPKGKLNGIKHILGETVRSGTSNHPLGPNQEGRFPPVVCSGADGRRKNLRSGS